MHAGFTACVIFKDAGPPPAKLGSSSFQCSAPNKTDLSRQAKTASRLFSPSVWPDQKKKKKKLYRHWGLSWSGPIWSDFWRCVWEMLLGCFLSPNLLCDEKTASLVSCMSKQNSKCLLLPSVTFIISMIWFEHLHRLSECLFTTSPVSSCTPELCSPVYRSRCSLSPTVTLWGPKGPMEGYYYPLSKWTEGDHKTTLLSCSDGNPTPVELFERPGKWVQESRGLWSPPLRYLQQCQHHARLPIWEKTPLWHRSECFKC